MLVIRSRLAILLGESHDAVMRSISADSLRHGHAPSLLILFLRYLENQSNPRLILPCKFLMINLVASFCLLTVSLRVLEGEFRFVRNFLPIVSVFENASLELLSCNLANRNPGPHLRHMNYKTVMVSDSVCNRMSLGMLLRTGRDISDKTTER